MKLSKQLLIYWIQDLESENYTAGRFRLWSDLEEESKNHRACCIGVLDYCHLSREKSTANLPKNYPSHFRLDVIGCCNLQKTTQEKIKKYLSSNNFDALLITSTLEILLSTINDISIDFFLPGNDKYAQVIDVLKILSEDPLFV